MGPVRHLFRVLHLPERLLMLPFAKIVSVLVVAVLVAGCGGEPVADPAAGGTQTEAQPAAAADTAVQALLTIITQSILWAAAEADFVPATAGQQLEVGDQVRTDDAGFAEITYHDGSWQRVDSNATVTIVELVSTGAADVVRMSVDVGRSWNNVRELTGPADAYEIQTPVATASVRGTIFATDCPDTTRCTFTAVEGTILITPLVGDAFELTAPATVTIGADAEPPQPTVLEPSELDTDPWLTTNRELDRNTTDDPPDTTTTDDQQSDEPVDLAAVDACTLLTEAEVEALVGRPIEETTSRTSARGGAFCDWSAGWVEYDGEFGVNQHRTGILLEIYPRTGSVDDDSFVFGDECVQESYTEHGSGGQLVRCGPSSISIHVSDGGLGLSFSVDVERAGPSVVDGSLANAAVGDILERVGR